MFTLRPAFDLISDPIMEGAPIIGVDSWLNNALLLNHLIAEIGASNGDKGTNIDTTYYENMVQVFTGVANPIEILVVTEIGTYTPSMRP